MAMWQYTNQNENGTDCWELEMPGKMTDGWRGSRRVRWGGRMYLEENNLDCDVGWHLSDPLCGCGGPARSDGHRPTHIS